MQTIIIYGTGSYVLGNKYVKPVILPSILSFLKKNNLNANLIFIKKTISNITKTRNSIKKIINDFNIKIKYEIYDLENNNNFEILTKLEKLDILFSIISVPDKQHFELASQCLKKFIDIIVVKPLVTSVSENLKLINLAKKNNCLGFVDYHKRFDMHSKLIKEYNYDKKNDLYLIDINYSQKKNIPINVFNWTEETNILNYLGSHYLDFVSHTTSFKPTYVMAIGIKKLLIKKNCNTYDSIVCLVKWKNKSHEFLLNLKTSWIDPLKDTAMSDQKVTLYYTNSKIISDQKNRGFYISDDLNDYESINPDFNQTFKDIINKSKSYEGYGFKSLISYMEMILNKSKITNSELKNLPTLQSSLAVSQILDAASKSLKNKSKWIKI